MKLFIYDSVQTVRSDNQPVSFSLFFALWSSVSRFGRGSAACVSGGFVAPVFFHVGGGSTDGFARTVGAVMI